MVCYETPPHNEKIFANKVQLGYGERDHANVLRQKQPKR